MGVSEHPLVFDFVLVVIQSVVAQSYHRLHWLKAGLILYEIVLNANFFFFDSLNFRIFSFPISILEEVLSLSHMLLMIWGIVRLCFHILLVIQLIIHLGMSLNQLYLILDPSELQKHCFDLYIVVFPQVGNFIFQLIDLTVFPLLSFNKDNGVVKVLLLQMVFVVFP